MNFPSVMYVYEAHARAARARIVEVPSDDGITIDTQRMVDAIDEETLLVPISHVLFKSAYIQDVKAIVEGAPRRRAGRARRLSIGGHGSVQRQRA